jgi:hypothetical protein
MIFNIFGVSITSNVYLRFVTLATINMITPTMKKINTTPDQTPALKIPPIASQLLKLTAIKAIKQVLTKCFLISFVLSEQSIFLLEKGLQKSFAVVNFVKLNAVKRKNGFIIINLP